MPPFLCTATQNVVSPFCDCVGLTVGFVLTDRSSYFQLYIYIYNEEAIVTGREIIIILNVLLKVCFSLLNNAHIVKCIPEQANLKQFTVLFQK